MTRYFNIKFKAFKTPSVGHYEQGYTPGEEEAPAKGHISGERHTPVKGHTLGERHTPAKRYTCTPVGRQTRQGYTPLERHTTSVGEGHPPVGGLAEHLHTKMLPPTIRSNHKIRNTYISDISQRAIGVTVYLRLFSSKEVSVSADICSSQTSLRQRPASLQFKHATEALPLQCQFHRFVIQVKGDICLIEGEILLSLVVKKK